MKAARTIHTSSKDFGMSLWFFKTRLAFGLRFLMKIARNAASLIFKVDANCVMNKSDLAVV